MSFKCRYRTIQTGSDNATHQFLVTALFLFMGMEQFSMSITFWL